MPTADGLADVLDDAGLVGATTPSLLAAIRRRSLAELRRDSRGVINARWQLRAATRLGRWPLVTGRLHVSNLGGELVVGDRVRMYSHYARSVLAVFPGGRLEIGDGCVLNYGCDIAATGLVQIGRDCMLGTHVSVLDNDFHDLHNRTRQPAPRPVILEDGVWLGNHVVVLPGVRIGRGSVVSAGSVVTRDVPPGTVAVGHPARVVRQLWDA